jgi:hypothetical protein
MMVVFLPFPSYACRSLSSESRTFLTFLPDEAASKNIAAKIEIVPGEVVKKDGEIFIGVRVVDPIKGVQKDQKFFVGIFNSTCNRDYLSGSSFYIAGDFSDDGNFRGEWKGPNYAPDVSQHENQTENP